MEIRQAKRLFEDNIRSALHRRIAWELTFEQWLALWGDRIDQRGRNKGQFQLCRKNDIGPYAIGNCYVATITHNTSVRGFKETRTHARYLGDLYDQQDAMRESWDPLQQLILEEERGVL